MLQTKFVGKIKTNILEYVNFSQNSLVYAIMWKNVIQLDRPQMAIYYGACAVHAA